jgi:hypothetical protein
MVAISLAFAFSVFWSLIANKQGHLNLTLARPALPFNRLILTGSIIAIIVILLIVLFYPYIKVLSLYGAHRD